MIKTYRVDIEHEMSEAMMKWIAEDKPFGVSFWISPGVSACLPSKHFVSITDKQLEFFFELTFSKVILGSFLTSATSMELVELLVDK
tara:strand:+ start:5580 stop:5840 length:261 start_codon:yes stop_codon:yes gene_type:complete